jgi:HipA-like protein
MNGERVGTWQRTRTGGNRFVYAESWLASDRVRPLSLSLPITPDRTVAGPVVAHFFDNLLPDDERIRRRVSARFRIGSTDVFELLQAIGRDCVGAGPCQCRWRDTLSVHRARLGSSLGLKIIGSAIVAAPLQFVRAAYTTADDIEIWNTACPDWHTTASTVDLRPGGKFSCRMEAKDGSFGFDFAGEYTQVVRLASQEQPQRAAWGPTRRSVHSPIVVTAATHTLDTEEQGCDSSSPHRLARARHRPTRILASTKLASSRT